MSTTQAGTKEGSFKDDFVDQRAVVDNIGKSDLRNSKLISKGKKCSLIFCRAVVESNVPRTSNMEAPIMLLSGHSGEVFVPVF